MAKKLGICHIHGETVFYHSPDRNTTTYCASCHSETRKKYSTANLGRECRICKATDAEKKFGGRDICSTCSRKESYAAKDHRARFLYVKDKEGEVIKKVSIKGRQGALVSKLYSRLREETGLVVNDTLNIKKKREKKSRRNT